MKTDRLIEILGSHVEPVRRSRLGLPLALAMAVGGVAAFCAMLAVLGLRSDLAEPAVWGLLSLKLLFAASLLGLGAAALMRYMRPGQDPRRLSMLMAVPFVALGLAALVALAFARPTDWGQMVLGPQWATRLLCIPIFAILPFGALVWAVRQGAPTDLRRAGAIMGQVAGALGAAAYAFFCPDDSLPSIALWYAAAIALCALGGAWLGPRLLRW